MLDKAISIAVKAHTGQLDKGGKPYILHPLHVMMQMDTEEERITAILHDVLEDSSVSLVTLCLVGIPTTVVNALSILARKKGQSYREYIKDISENKLATKVKIADLEHNMDLSRIPNPTKKDYDRIAKYKTHYDYLKSIKEK